MKKVWVILMAGVLLVLTGCGDKSAVSLQRLQARMEMNAKVIRVYVDEILNKGKLSVADPIIGPEFTDPAFSPGDQGPKALKQLISDFREVFPDLEVTIDEMVVGRDKVAWSWTAVATHEGEIFGIPATGRAVTFSGIILDTVIDGKIVQRRGTWDRMGLQQQLTDQ